MFGLAGVRLINNEGSSLDWVYNTYIMYSNFQSNITKMPLFIYIHPYSII